MGVVTITHQVNELVPGMGMPTTAAYAIAAAVIAPGLTKIGVPVYLWQRPRHRPHPA